MSHRILEEVLESIPIEMSSIVLIKDCLILMLKHALIVELNLED